jgi:hypothetical protein
MQLLTTVWHSLYLDPNHQYGYAFFWAISVVTGIGWDIVPATGIEVAFSSIMIIAGTVLYITILGSVTSIVSNINQANHKKRARLEAIITHLTKSKASRSLMNKIRGYYDFMWADEAICEDSGDFSEDVEALPKSLQLGIFGEMHRDIVEKVPLLSRLGHQAVFAVAREWTRQIYLPLDQIVQEGAPVTSLYFVVRGVVRMGTTQTAMMGRSKMLVLIDIPPGEWVPSAVIDPDPNNYRLVYLTLSCQYKY